MADTIYLDHAATTPLDPAVAQAMWPFLTGHFGNPSSIHAAGRIVRAAVDEARDRIASALHADYSEITFTSSGTEADNLAVIGAMLAAPAGRNHLVISSIEHHAVLHAARHLEKEGYLVTELPVDEEGFVQPHVLEEAITDRTALVSIHHGNNEIGTIQDVPKLAKIAHARGALFHTDAVQTFGALPLNVVGMGADMLSVSAHKIYGPKGAGALYVKSGVKVSQLLFGGAQERERRPGTENVAGIVGFGVAAEQAGARRQQDAEKLLALRDRLMEGILTLISGIRLNGPRQRRLANNVNVSIDGVDGAAVLMNLDRAGIAASSGSACSSGSIEPSHVLKAIGLSDDLAASGIRFTLGRGNTEEEIDRTVETLQGILERIRRS
jgi:Cysteine sulfinate desulfinase/cysteine desulfurase and related enzymes